MKLKTLKDIEVFEVRQDLELEGVEYPLIDRNDLKKEAIKLVKNFRKRNDEIWEIDFMNFFNITEEDLK